MGRAVVAGVAECPRLGAVRQPTRIFGTPVSVSAEFAALVTAGRNEYCEQLDDAAPTGDVPVAGPFWELHNLTEDPDERSNVVEQHP